MTTSFLRFRTRVPSNKGYGSSCFSSFAPLASFSFFLFLPPAPRNSPHHQIHTRTHTHTPRSKALPAPSLRSSPVLFPTPWPATFQTGLLNLLYCCLKGTLRFPEMFAVPVLDLDSGVHEKIYSFSPDLSDWAPFKGPPSVPLLLALPTSA